MLNAEDILKLKILKAEGMSISAIARKTCHARETIRKYISSVTQIVQIKKRQRKSKNLCEPFKEIIIGHIKNGFSAAFIYRDLTAKHGFLGSDTTLKDFVRQQRRNLQLPHQDEFSASLWTLKILQGEIKQTDLELQFKDKLNTKDVNTLYNYINDKPIKYRNKALTILLYLKGISKTVIANTLFLERSTVRTYIQIYEERGTENLFKFYKKSMMKCDDPRYKDAVLSILHAPPSCYDINRTTWRMIDIKNIMAQKGLPICEDNIRKIIKNAGYSFRKAKRVLTSNDPNYMEKLKEITKILSNLKPKEKFFSIDEYGHLQ
jgi:transposase